MIDGFCVTSKAGSKSHPGGFDEPRGVKLPPPALPSNLSEILAYGFWMRREGYRSSTIQAAISALKALAKKTRFVTCRIFGPSGITR